MENDKTPNYLSQLEARNIVAFILNHKIKNENGSEIEFMDHNFMLQPFTDVTPEQAHKKCAQIGGSVKEILRSFWLAKHLRANVIYTLPTRNSVRDFVLPKVNPIIENNKILQTFIHTTDSIELKKVGDRFVYFRGSWGQESAISISAHILINDEKDHSNQKTLRTYRSRLDDAKRERPDLGWIMNFSNPTLPDYGIDADYKDTKQFHWYVKCHRCNHWQFMKWPDNVDIKRGIYICDRCHLELDREDRRTGRWIAHRPKNPRAGYWYSQLMVPWIPATKIIADWNEGKGDQSIFHNFTLGEAYQSGEAGITRADILNCIVMDRNPETDVAIGVDVGVTKNVVIGNRYGIFKVLETDSWDEIEQLRNYYGAYMVIDAMPDHVKPKKLAKKYPGKVFVCYYDNQKKNIQTIEWGTGDDRHVVRVDRVKIFDETVADLHSQDTEFTGLNAIQLDDYIKHWGNMYRTTEMDAQDRQVVAWKTKGEETGAKKPDHFSHATIYFKVALSKTSSSGGIVKPDRPKRNKESPTVSADNTVPGLKLSDVLDRVRKENRRRRRPV